MLNDFVLSDDLPLDLRGDMLNPLQLVFDDAFDQGVLDRRVEIVFRELDGLPRGTVKAVIDAFADLVDEGCLAVIGPNISENTVALRDELERFRVPAISLCGTDAWLGRWSFNMPTGSMTDEPIFIAHLMAQAGQRTAGVLMEQSLIGQHYLRGFRDACRFEGVKIVAEEPIPQVGTDIDAAVHALHAAKPDAVVHLGFGLGVTMINQALKAVGWDPPRYMGTAWIDAFLSPELWEAYVGWIGLDQYDEENAVGQQFLDRFAQVHGRRPSWSMPLVFRDVASALVRALSMAEPLSPRGVMEGLERVKLMPAASGSPGTRVSFGNWTRMGWVGAGYLTARTVNPDGETHRLVGRYGQV